MNNTASDIIKIKPSSTFVKTDQIKNIVNRSLAYLGSGYPVHFSGPTGTGKTTLALHIAGMIKRPTVLLHGDDEFGPSDLLSNQKGFSREKVVDNFIHSVVKIKEKMEHEWSDSRLITACRQGYTLIYDEFTRSRPEANNILLSILEERMLSLPSGRNDTKYLKVHPEFNAIFTSNPEEYVGTHKTQDALIDRIITINLEGFDERTEVEIIMSHSNLDWNTTKKIFKLVHDFRDKVNLDKEPTLRRAIMIAKIVAGQGVKVTKEDKLFHQICRDVLVEEPVHLDGINHPKTEEGQILADLIEKDC